MVDIVPRREQLRRRLLRQLHDGMDSALDAVQDVVAHPEEEEEALGRLLHREAIVDGSKDDSLGVDGLPRSKREMNRENKIISASDRKD